MATSDSKGPFTYPSRLEILVGKLDGGVSTNIHRPILVARRSKQDTAQEVVLLPPSINPTKIPSPFMLAIARITTYLLYFPCTLGHYLSHNIVPVQRHNSHHGFVRRHCQLVRYLGR